MYQFEADVGDDSQGVLHGVCPLPLSQGVLLGADHIQVVGDVVGRVVPGLPLTLTLEPGPEALRRARIAWQGGGVFRRQCH